MYDAIIIGGGPAGLNAALVLGRCRRRVLVCDAGQPRNASAAALHGFLSRDGMAPRELLRLGREEAGRYGVELLDAEVVEARALPEEERPGLATGFRVTLADGRAFTARKLVLATGLRDHLPPVEGAPSYYGRGVYHCPYCDGWEHRDQALVAYGAGEKVVGLALSLLTWSSRVTACTDGEALSDEGHARLARHGVSVREARIVRLEGRGEPGGMLDRIVFEDGPALPCSALFFSTGHAQGCDLPERLGCLRDEKDEVRTWNRRTGIPGLFIAGDADGDVQFVVVAAAEGASAAVALNIELQQEERP